MLTDEQGVFPATYPAGIDVRDARIAALERENERARRWARLWRCKATSWRGTAYAFHRQENRRIQQLSAELRQAGAENERMRAAIERYLELNSSCDYVDGEPDVCPGVAERGHMCHWCELRAAVAASSETKAGHDARIVELERALIDMENWIEAALREPMLAFPRPASFGKWRRPKEGER